MERKVALLEQAIQLDAFYPFLQDDIAGGICLFIGTIRNKNQNKDVKSLDMEAYPPMAVKQINLLIDQAGSTWPIQKVVMAHRTGPLQIGDIAVLIGVTCVHRAEAFQACQWLIDRLKEEVPIWKNEFYEDGSSWLVPHP
ncbi:molybdenum cofactor biosynthesis protein MoaE [Cytophagaceae bacterium 50C-KIRBA]|uniref:Molybdopterin synthase catalytic subunit n=1 Tax=Aquirufa beregesia TaxID=2516556 RepID=A0ABX0EUB9_9BACT|nr:molybdenum cofactor biosynthesis protein MoaE [Aquirufa beregesia]NGZ44139.1 molybdenum cofactor biosynthesis protein MoaE [Aquirufa beregesia]